MGRVFSIAEVKGGAVPAMADFETSLEGFLTAAEQEIKQGTIDGAVIFGSVAIGSYSRRSDLDCMIVPPDYSQPSIAAIRRVMAQANQGDKVQVNPIMHSRSRLASGNHEIDRFFGVHLTGEGRLVRGNDPAEYMCHAARSSEAILYDYIHNKKRNIMSVFHAEDAERYKYLARILELPLAVGRKALRANDEAHGTDISDFNTAEKTKLARRALELFAFVGLDEVPQGILSLDHTYSATLDQMMAEEITESDYAEVIEEIAATAARASQWLDDFEIAFREQVV